MVDRCCRISSTMRSSTCGQIDPVGSAVAPEDDPPRDSAPRDSEVRDWTVPGTVMSSTGTTTDRSNVFAAGGCTMVTGARPPRKRATSSSGRTVAESPMRWAGFGSSSSSLSSDTARCAPRFVEATACTSSMMTVSTLARVSRAAEVSMRYSDSGVVIRMSGGSRASNRRSPGVVSPLRTPTVTSGAGSPSRRAVCVTPTSGARRLRCTSTPRAFSGEI